MGDVDEKGVAPQTPPPSGYVAEFILRAQTLAVVTQGRERGNSLVEFEKPGFVVELREL